VPSAEIAPDHRVAAETTAPDHRVAAETTAPDHRVAAETTAPDHPVAAETTAPDHPAAVADPMAPDHPAGVEVGDPTGAAEAAAPDHPASVAADRPLPIAATAARGAVADDDFAALAEAQAAVLRAWHAVGGEIAGLGRCANDLAAHAAIEMLGVKSITDALQINVRFAGESFDDWLERSARLSELAIALAAETSRPILAFLGRGWVRAVGLTS
jgi:hypothetical protein